MIQKALIASVLQAAQRGCDGRLTPLGEAEQHRLDSRGGGATGLQSTAHIAHHHHHTTQGAPAICTMRAFSRFEVLPPRVAGAPLRRWAAADHPLPC